MVRRPRGNFLRLRHCGRSTRTVMALLTTRLRFSNDNFRLKLPLGEVTHKV